MAVMAGRRRAGGRAATAWIGWLAVTFVVISLYLGALLRLPQWLLDAVPGRPDQGAESSIRPLALAAMVVAAAALTFVAGAIYRRRDAI